jgi:hypothetical protein
MKTHNLEAAPTALTKEIKNQKAPKAKLIAVGIDAHLRGYQASREVDNAAVGPVQNLRSETEVLLYAEKQLDTHHRRARLRPSPGQHAPRPSGSSRAAARDGASPCRAVGFRSARKFTIDFQSF